MLKQYKLRNYKFILVILVITLNTIGLLLVGSARPALLNKQMLGMFSGILLMVFVSLIDYNFILKFPWLIYIAMIGLLLAVIFFGDDAGGAQRWIKIGESFTFQPSEFAKIVIILFFATRSFVRPLEELSKIATKMSHLDFAVKYPVKTKDEIGELGQSINLLSEKLEKTISDLKSANNQLQTDIEQKVQIDEMRKDFLSNLKSYKE